jgi:site-specific DNA recombinase
MGGVIRLEEYARRRRELEEKTEAFESQERELGQQTDRRAELSGMVSRVEDYCRRVSEALAGASFEQKRRLVELLIDRVIVTEAEVRRFALSDRCLRKSRWRPSALGNNFRNTTGSRGPSL